MNIDNSVNNINPSHKEGFFVYLCIYDYMKYIINENRLIEIFNSYMDSVYNLSYDEKDNERVGGINWTYIRDSRGEIFGTVVSYQFYYVNDSMEEVLYGMFGEHSYQLMLEYLNKKFPSFDIQGIG